MDSRLHHRFAPAAIVVLLAAVVFPFAANAMEQEFYVGVVSRLMIFALAATSLNLVLGFGGMVSLGHAAYFGTGAYAVGILMQHGVSSAWLSWPVAMAASAVLATFVGLISLRTRGVYFIMITLACAQMVYFLFVSLRAYGGDDGLSLVARSSTGVDISSDTAFYYVVLALLAAAMLFVHRLVNSRFGRVVQGIRENESRMEAIGYPVFRYKLICFVIGGALAGLAGALIANQNMLVSPNLIHWTQSGMLMVMVILGGVGYLFGGVVGAIAILLLEEILSGYTMHWQLALGIVLLIVVMVLPNGLLSLFDKRRKDAP